LDLDALALDIDGGGVINVRADPDAGHHHAAAHTVCRKAP
jgi:hypothetical protein